MDDARKRPKMVKIINIKWGIIGLLFGTIVLITFNQNITTIIGQANEEGQLLLTIGWLIFCFILIGYIPIASSISDDKNGEDQ